MNWPIADLIPHSADMVLLDELIACDDETVHTRLIVRPDSLLSGPDGSIPAWCGIELMAQSIGAYAGFHARRGGQPVTMGFLLGTRQYRCNVEQFPPGTELHIHARASLQDENGMGVFECVLTGPDIQAEARLNVFCPPDTGDYLQEE
ncbi:ApeP family dehydratase [Pseudomonas matsuisoli]|uniref:3-hydroxylacyl-ACP dehydratase n=1 Tax=Pseudomonas matsuisoli TaxID=1515666 RepID=A0A917PY63_9PSED|nr:hotdog family protein [Pseudomonas matsuisoli]GGJ99103.1 3-hydroxylacyl-ACP dehydratase [Pseudomonas matsuisoli]